MTKTTEMFQKMADLLMSTDPKIREIERDAERAKMDRLRKTLAATYCVEWVSDFDNSPESWSMSLAFPDGWTEDEAHDLADAMGLSFHSYQGGAGRAFAEASCYRRESDGKLVLSAFGGLDI